MPKHESVEVDFAGSIYASLKDGLPFLNTSVSDLEHQPVLLLHGESTSEAILRSPSLRILNHCDESTLLSYYEANLSRMITTIDDVDNGFRATILPLALSSNDASSHSLLQATLSLSALHLGRPDEAVQYRVSAIKSLSASLSSEIHSREVQLATCMMLCVNGVSFPGPNQKLC